MNLEVRVMPIEAITPSPFNPRVELRPTDRAYRKLAASLREFGLVEPLVWNETTNRLVGGHARLRILREMGEKEVPVSVVRLPEPREKALNVVLNNAEAQGRYDTARLAELLDELADTPELELTGFDERLRESLRLQPEPPIETPPQPATESSVEITLVMSATTYDRLAPTLDSLLLEYDVTSHVRKVGDQHVEKTCPTKRLIPCKPR